MTTLSRPRGTRARGVGLRAAAGLVAVALASLTGGGPAAAADPVAVVASEATPPLPDMGDDAAWWFTFMRIPQVWAEGAHGQGVTVAVVDSGVIGSWPELRGRVLQGTDFASGNGWTAIDKRAHGTAMAIDIAGQGGPFGLVGIAPEVKILPVTDPPDYDRAFRWAVDHGAKVINASFAAEGPCPPAVAEAVRYAVEHGAVVVAGSGNNGPTGPELHPGDCPGVVTAGAVDHLARLAQLSNRGPSLDFAAPGYKIVSINRNRVEKYYEGTSDSTAFVSGAIALVWSKYPHLTARQVVARLIATARDYGPPGRDQGYGFGIARPYQAIVSRVPADAPNPIFDEIAPGAGSSSAPTGPATPTPTPGGAAAPAPTRSAAPSQVGEVVTGLLPLFAVLVLGVLAVSGVVAVVLSRSRRRREQAARPAVPPYAAGRPPYPPAGPPYPPVGPPVAGPPVGAPPGTPSSPPAPPSGPAAH